MMVLLEPHQLIYQRLSSWFDRVVFFINLSLQNFRSGFQPYFFARISQLSMVLDGRPLQQFLSINYVNAVNKTAICADDAAVFLNEIGLLTCGNYLTWLLNGNLTLGALLIEAGIDLLISVLGKLNMFHLVRQITLIILILKWKGLSYMNFFFQMEGWSFLNCFLHWLYSQNCHDLFYSVIFKVAFDIFKSTVCFCMKYCCHAWAVALNWSSNMFGEPQKRVQYLGQVVLHPLLLTGMLWPF